MSGIQQAILNILRPSSSVCIDVSWLPNRGELTVHTGTDSPVELLIS